MIAYDMYYYYYRRSFFITRAFAIVIDYCDDENGPCMFSFKEKKTVEDGRADQYAEGGIRWEKMEKYSHDWKPVWENHRPLAPQTELIGKEDSGFTSAPLVNPPDPACPMRAVITDSPSITGLVDENRRQTTEQLLTITDRSGLNRQWKHEFQLLRLEKERTRPQFSSKLEEVKGGQQGM